MTTANNEKFDKFIRYIRKHAIVIQLYVLAVLNIGMIGYLFYHHHQKVEHQKEVAKRYEEFAKEMKIRNAIDDSIRNEKQRIYDSIKYEKYIQELTLKKNRKNLNPAPNGARRRADDEYDDYDEDDEDAMEEYLYDNYEDML